MKHSAWGRKVAGSNQLCLKVEFHDWTGSVQGAVATW